MKSSPISSTFGTQIEGVDVSRPLSDAAFDDIANAFFAGQVLVLRDQHLTPAQYVAFGRRFGPPEPHVIDQFHHSADSNILILSNRRNNGAPVGSPTREPTSTPTIRTCRCRRGRRCSIQSRCPRSAAIHCSRISTRHTTIFPTQ